MQGALRHSGALSAVEVRPSGMLLTACQTNSTLRVYELEAAHLAATRIAEAGLPPPVVAPTAGVNEWNYVERARLQDRHAEPCVVAAKWLNETTLVEVGFETDEENDAGPPQPVLRAWSIGDLSPQRARVFAADSGLFAGNNLSSFSSLATGDGLVAVTYNPPLNGPGYADVWRYCDASSSSADAWNTLVPMVRLEEHTAPIYASALGGGLLATGGDDCTVRLWSTTGAAFHMVAESPSTTGAAAAPSLQTLQLPGKVWALALHSQLLVVGGALVPEADGSGSTPAVSNPVYNGTGTTTSRICVRLFGVADLAAGRGHAVALRTLHAPSIAHHWGVRSVATHGGTIVVANPIPNPNPDPIPNPNPNPNPNNSIPNS